VIYEWVCKEFGQTLSLISGLLGTHSALLGDSYSDTGTVTHTDTYIDTDTDPNTATGIDIGTDTDDTEMGSKSFQAWSIRK